MYEDIDGRQPSMPWKSHVLDAVLSAMGDLAGRLTPSPLPVGTARDASLVFAETACGWTKLRAATLPGLSEWAARNLDRLAEAEREAPQAVRGQTLVHMDIRADNVLLAGDSVYFVDWPHAAVGVLWLDLVLFAPSVAIQGGPRPAALLERSHAAKWVGDERLTAAVVSMAGYFVRQSLLPPPPGLPTLRGIPGRTGPRCMRLGHRAHRVVVTPDRREWQRIASGVDRPTRWG